MSKKNKIILIVSMVAILAAVAVLNVFLLTESGDLDTEVPVANFFESSRADRQSTRAYEIEQLNSILNMEGDEYQEARANALAKKIAIIEAMELEYLLETALRAQGFVDAIVTVSTTSDSVNVIVDDDELLRDDTAKIYSTITQETSILPDYIYIFAI